MMFCAKVKLAAAVFAGAAVVLGGGGTLAAKLAAGEPDKPKDQPKAEKKLNPQVMALGDNTWLKMNPKPEVEQRAYSSICRGHDGKYFYFGGAHGTYKYDDIAFYDLVTNTWTRSWEDRKEGDRSIAGHVEKFGRMPPVHFYQQACWYPERKVYFYSGYMGTWEFDPATMKWKHLLAGSSYQPKDMKVAPYTKLAWQTMICFYSPDLKAPVLMCTTDPYGVYLWDQAKGEWKKRAKSFPGTLVWSEPYETYMPGMGCHLITGKDSYWLYTPVTEEWKAVGSLPKGMSSSGIAYDEVNKLVLFFCAAEPLAGEADSKDIVVWTLDPATMKATKVDRVGNGPKGNPAWRPVCYDPDHNAFLYLNHTGGRDETWVYRYKQTGK